MGRTRMFIQVMMVSGGDYGESDKGVDKSVPGDESSHVHS